MRKVDELFAHYGESHQNKTNKAIHFIAVPSILLSIVALIWSIPFPKILPEGMQNFVNWASILIAISMYYYWNLSKSLAIGMLLLFGLFSWIIVSIEQTGFPLWQASLIIFVIAWIFQFVGHKIEGKKPSFLEDVQYLLIGPYWILHFIYSY
jgi:uncharacterized membrane protein YGL010W